MMMRSVVRRFLLFSFIGFVSVLLNVIPAFAHANLVRSQPAANDILAESPTQLRFWFSETPEPRFSEIRLLDRSRQEIAGLGAIQADPTDNKLLTVAIPPLQPGIYTVAWKALSAVDGHITAGGFSFVVGLDQVPAEGIPTSTTSVTSQPTLPGTIVRWMTYLSLALLLGGFAFVPLVLQPALRKADTVIQKQQAPDTAKQQQSQPFSHSSGLFAILVLSSVLLAIATFGQALLQATSVNSDLFLLLTSTRFGLIFWLRVVLLIVLAGLLIFRQSRAWRSSMAQRWWQMGMVVSALLLLTVSLNSHAAALNNFALALDWLHFIVVGLWLGGLVTLLLALRWLHSEKPDSALPTSAVLISRFSQVATICLLLILITGTGQGIFQVETTLNLLDTDYGRTLLLKVGLFLPLLGIAASNFLLTRRRIDQAVKDDSHVIDSNWQSIIRRTVMGEIAFIAAVLLVTAILSATPPGREAFGSGLILRSQAADLRLVVAIDPGIPGLNTFNIYLKDTFGNPIREVQKVALLFSSLDMEMGVIEAVTQTVDEGHYVVNGNYLSMGGNWKIDALIRRKGRDDVRTTLQLNVINAVTTTNTEFRITPTLLLGIELIIAGSITVFGSRRLRRASVRAGNWAVRIGVVLSVVGLIVSANGFTSGTSSVPDIANPVPASPESLARGQVIYTTHCVNCHGETGIGDGPLGAVLNPPPADFRIHMRDGHTDGMLFNWITNGKPTTAMPAFGVSLSEQERWDVINYIKTFAGTR